MGLFDSVRCSMKLDDRFSSNDVFQTKDLDCTMDFFWIDPNGVLWQIDDSKTYTFVEEDQEKLDQAFENREWLPPFYEVPTGEHGKVVPYDFTGIVRIYPSDWKSKLKDKWTYLDWPEYKLTFKNGKVSHIERLK